MRANRLTIFVSATLIGLLAAGVPAPSIAAARAAIPSDFNGDGHADLAIGVIGEGHEFAGAVNVLYGSANGLTAAGDQLWSLDTPGVKGSISRGWGEYFGRALASGDFDRDGYADLAIGVPGDKEGETGPHTGGVNVLYGSARGLTAAGDQRWSQANLPGAPNKDDEFGWAVAAGDFDGDGFWDLAIGVPGEAVGGQINRGVVQILYGGVDGLSATGTATLDRSMTGAAYSPFFAHWFGRALAAGDLDGDGAWDLAVGAPGAGNMPGDVAVFSGATAGLTPGASTLWSQETPGIEDDLGSQDRFGWALAIGDFDGSATADLAIGVAELASPCDCGGRVNVLYGTPGGLTTTAAQNWSAESPGIPGPDTTQDLFGETLAAGDFNADGRDELAISADDYVHGSGRVIVLTGSSAGLTTTGLQRWTQGSVGVPGKVEDGDQFGAALFAANFGRSAAEDLAIGVPGENHSRGVVDVLYGRATGLGSVNAQGWSQSTTGVKGTATPEDVFGAFLP